MRTREKLKFAVDFWISKVQTHIVYEKVFLDRSYRAACSNLC